MMFSQEPISRIMSNTNNNAMLFSSSTNIMYDDVGEKQWLMKGKDTMVMQSTNEFQQLQNPIGLTRYRSAPSTFFASYVDGYNVKNTNSDSSQDGDTEAEYVFSAFMGCSDGSSSNMGMQSLINLKQENELASVNSSNKVHETSINGTSSNNLFRQCSSSAGFFDGFDISRNIQNFRSISESNSTSNGVNNQLNFLSLQSTAPRFINRIAEPRKESIGIGNSKDGQCRNGTNSDGRSCIPGSWNDSYSSSLKRNHDGDIKLSSFTTLQNEKSDSRNQVHGLTHHLSLPKTSPEMVVIEKYLDFQQENAVPCKLRAKRGFATHPRSIAERVRRTRLSERMKKLQELFPNMDKQTSTADMLDLAVEHIKELQQQVQTLGDIKGKCKCPS